MTTYKLTALPALLALALLFAACNDRVVYHNSKTLEEEQWSYDDTLRFHVEIYDSLSLHKLYLDVRNTTDYDYRNLFLFMDIEFPGGQILRDTLECILAERDGTWTGSGFGRFRSNRFLFRDDVWFPEKGVYTFKICQGMRYDTLPGISDIGIRIERK